MDRLIRVLGKREDQLVPVGYVGRPGGPGYVTSPGCANRFSEPAARQYVEDLRERLPGVVVEICPLEAGGINGFDSL